MYSPGGVEYLFVGVKCPRVDIPLGARDSGAKRDLRDRQGVVSGDDLYVNSLLSKEAEGLGGVFADFVCKEDKRDRHNLPGERHSFDIARVFCEKEHAASLFGISVDHLRILTVKRSEDHIGRTEDICQLGREYGGHRISSMR